MEKEETLISTMAENSVNLQKVVVEMTLAMNNLSKEISELITLFKEAAKNVEESKDSEIIEKLNSLEQQNRTIAQGITLLDSSLREKTKPLPEFKFT